MLIKFQEVAALQARRRCEHLKLGPNGADLAIDVSEETLDHLLDVVLDLGALVIDRPQDGEAPDRHQRQRGHNRQHREPRRNTQAMAAQEPLHDRSARILGGLWQRISARRAPNPQHFATAIVKKASGRARSDRGNLQLQDGMLVIVFAYRGKREFSKTGRQVERGGQSPDITGEIHR